MFTNPDAEGALRAQDDASFRENFIAQNAPFIRAAASRAMRHVVTEHEDAWSIAMIAFNEAIDKYIPERGNFASFAQVVIGRRLTDELRRDYRRRAEISVEPAMLSGSEMQETWDGSAAAAGQAAQAAMARAAQEAHLREKSTAAEEIEAVQQILRAYGFSFFDLADASPRAEKTKRECAKAVGALLRDQALFSSMQEKKVLPMKALEAASGVKKKILERHRRYIIAAAVILNGEYPLLAQYMDYIRKAMKT